MIALNSKRFQNANNCKFNQVKSNVKHGNVQIKKKKTLVQVTLIKFILKSALFYAVY